MHFLNMPIKQLSPKKQTNSGAYYLCADDFGLTPEVNDAILQLSEKKVLDGVSVMAFGSWPKDYICRIRSNGVDLGLHIDFTSGLNHRASNELYHLLIKSHLRALDKNNIKDVILFQIEEFVQKVGGIPDFIDGHQHVHQLPIIREMVLKALEVFGISNDVWIRNTITNDLSNIKADLLNVLGGVRSKAILNKSGYQTNDNFLGVYNFSSSDNYRKYFQNWMLKSLKKDGWSLIMCHPGLGEGPSFKDAITASRFKEFEYLSSEQYCEDMLGILRRRQ